MSSILSAGYSHTGASTTLSVAAQNFQRMMFVPTGLSVVATGRGGSAGEDAKLPLSSVF